MSTPRTDALAVSVTKKASHHLCEAWDEAVSADFARALETELQQAQAALAAVTLERDEAKAMLHFIRDAGWTVGTYQRVSSMHLNRGIRAEGVVGDFDGLIRRAMQSDKPYCANGLYDQLTEARAQLPACQSREAKALEALKELQACILSTSMHRHEFWPETMLPALDAARLAIAQ